MARDLVSVLAEHGPTYTEYATDPTTTFYCKPCSEVIGDWVTWTPDHLAAVIEAEVIRPRERAAWDAGWRQGYATGGRRCDNPYAEEGDR